MYDVKLIAVPCAILLVDEAKAGLKYLPHKFLGGGGGLINCMARHPLENDDDICRSLLNQKRNGRKLALNPRPYPMLI